MSDPAFSSSDAARVTEEGTTSLRETLSRTRLILVIASVMLGMLLGALDQTIVGTAMPRIIAELRGLQHYAWVFTSYMLASTVMVPIYGKLSDIYGRKPFFLGGMLLFLLGSALSGTSQNMTQLIVYRAIQGLGAGALLPIVQAIVGDIFPPAERGRWQGIMMAVFGLASIVGPTAGGWITDYLGWRWVFYVNMPVGAVALVVAAVALPSQSRRSEHTIDYVGATTLIAATVPLLLAFSWAGTEYSWESPRIVGLLLFAAAMFGLFFTIEGRSAEPIISPRFFRSSIFTVSVVATFMVSVGMYGAIMYLPLFVQGVMGDSATGSGAVLTPMMLGFMASSVVGGQIMSRTGRYRILALGGFVIATSGMFLLSRMGIDATNALVVRNMIVTGLGIGVMMSLFTIIVQNAFPFSQLGQVTASLQFFRSIGGTIGVAIMGTVMSNSFQSALQSNLPAGLQRALSPSQLSALQNPQVLLSPAATASIQQGFTALGPPGQTLLIAFMSALRTSLADSIDGVFVLGTVAMALSFAVCLLLREIPLRTSHVETVPLEYIEDMNLTAEAVANTASHAGRRIAQAGVLVLAIIGLFALIGYPSGTLAGSVQWHGRPIPTVSVRWMQPPTPTSETQLLTHLTTPAASKPLPTIPSAILRSATAPVPTTSPVPTPTLPSNSPSPAPSAPRSTPLPAPTPVSTPTRTITPTGYQTYVVQTGDTLTTISVKFCGTPNDWTKIYDADRDMIQDPNRLHPGQTLIIPQC